MRRDLSDVVLAGTGRLVRVFVYSTLMLPVVVVAGASVTTTSSLRFPPEGFTLGWYRAAYDSEPFMDSLRTSTLLALFVTVVAMIVGGAVSFAIARHEFRGRKALEALLLSPLVIPAVVLGLGLLQLLAMAGLGRSPIGLVLGHVVTALPYVVRTLVASLALFDRTLEDAAASLRASPFRTLRKVTLPLLAPGLVSAATFAFVASFGNVTISVFLGFTGSVTLPVRIFASIENSYDPILAAVSVLVVIVTLILVVASERLAGSERR